MKRLNKGAAALRRIGVLMLAAILMVNLLCYSSAYALDSDEVERLNVMLVIDGSGSLTMAGGTDRNGNRYDAINLFLALLTNSGNNVGAIVFNHGTLLHAPIEPIDGKADKVSLAQKIKDAKAYGDTDIGNALLTAVDECVNATKQNGLQSVILLFSDGKTDVFGDPDLTAASLEKKEEATNNAQAAGIPIHSIALTSSNYADPVELEEASTRTSGSFSAVKTSEDLAAAFENFYKLIFPGASNEISKTVFPADGKLSFDIQIPTYGAEEVNIIVNTKSLTGKTITAPSGQMSDGDVENNTMTGGPYAVTKLVDPEKGLWNVSLTGTPGTDVTVNVLYNIDTSVQLQAGKTDFGVGETATLRANLMRQGAAITDTVVTQEYTAKLILTKLSTGEELPPIDMTPDANGTFVCSYTGTDYQSFTAKAVLTYVNLDLESVEVPLNFGNTAPVANPPVHEVKVTVTPISGKSNTVDVTGFFSDAQDSQLSYSMVSSQLVQNTADLNPNTGVMTVDTSKSRSGDVVIQATDSQGASAQMIVRFKVTNLTWLIFGSIIAAVVIGLIVVAVLLYIMLNKSYNGMVYVTTISNGIRRTHGSFRGRVPLSKLGVTGSTCGIDKAVLVATGNNQLELRTKQDVYVPGFMLKNPRKVMLQTGRNTVYSNNTQTNGLIIEVVPRPGVRR